MKKNYLFLMVIIAFVFSLNFGCKLQDFNSQNEEGAKLASVTISGPSEKGVVRSLYHYKKDAKNTKAKDVKLLADSKAFIEIKGTNKNLVLDPTTYFFHIKDIKDGKIVKASFWCSDKTRDGTEGEKHALVPKLNKIIITICSKDGGNIKRIDGNDGKNSDVDISVKEKPSDDENDGLVSENELDEEGSANNNSNLDDSNALFDQNKCHVLSKKRDDGFNIVGGTIVNSGDEAAGSTVAILMNGQFGCTGTLVGENQVLTAAHCLLNPRTQRRLSASEISVGFGLGVPFVERRSATGVQAHPSFRMTNLRRDPWSKQNPGFDVGVIVFSGSLPSGYWPVKIGDSDSIPPDKAVKLAGYGKTSPQDNSRNPRLREVNVTIKEVESVYRGIVLNGVGVKGGCNGDSGGPMYTRKKANQCFEVIGATSGAAEPGEDRYCGGGLYTDIRVYNGWLKCTFERLGKPIAYLKTDASSSECL